MSKLIYTVGLQGSGKSTWAKSELKRLNKKKTQVVRVNRDDLRSMVHNDICLDRKESDITLAQQTLVATFLASNVDVIVDDTNLSPKAVQGWVSLVQSLNARFAIEDKNKPENEKRKVTLEEKSFLDVSLATCIQQDAQRLVGRVGRAVITGAALRLGLIDFSEFDNWVIYDVDGTLADIKWRKPFDYKLVSQDKPRPEVVAEMQKDIAKGYGVIALSGRPSHTAGPVTDDWFAANGIFPHYFLQRRAKDIRPDTEIKEEIFKLLPKDKIVKVVDDRPCMVRKWRELFAGTNTEVKDVGDGIEF